MAQRSDLKPGDVFRVVPELALPDTLFVVTDAFQEVGFWEGGYYSIGSVCPSCVVDVVVPARPRRP